jgi:hypothetical protein
MDLAAHEIEVDIAQSRNAGKGLGHAFGFKDDGVIARRLRCVAGTERLAGLSAGERNVLNGNAVRRLAHDVPTRIAAARPFDNLDRNADVRGILFSQY